MKKGTRNKPLIRWWEISLAQWFLLSIFSPVSLVNFTYPLLYSVNLFKGCRVVNNEYLYLSTHTVRLLKKNDILFILVYEHPGLILCSNPSGQQKISTNPRIELGWASYSSRRVRSQTIHTLSYAHTHAAINFSK